MHFVDRFVPHVAAKHLKVMKAISTERSFERMILVSVSNLGQSDFVALLVDSDVHISTDAMWDASDSVVNGGDSISPQWQVHVARILDPYFASAEHKYSDWGSDRCAN